MLHCSTLYVQACTLQLRNLRLHCQIYQVSVRNMECGLKLDSDLVMSLVRSFTVLTSLVSGSVFVLQPAQYRSSFPSDLVASKQAQLLHFHQQS